MDRVLLVATLTEAPSDDVSEIRALPPDVGMLEVRGDLVGEIPSERLREAFPGRLLFTLRSRDEGGRFSGSLEERWTLLAAAGEDGYDLVDLEGERDLDPAVLDRLPPEQRLVSWHGPPTPFDELRDVFERISREPARYYKLIPGAEQPGEELAPLQLLHSLGRSDVVAFATGAVGRWTRMYAPYLGSPLVYGSAGDDPAAPGQLSIRQLIRDYPLPELPPVEHLYGIVGDPVAHSLSPRLHNGAYRELGIPALYVPFHTPSFGDFWLEVVENPILESLGVSVRGLSVTSPYKESALAVCAAPSPLAELVGGANTLVLHDGVWEAESTDPDGVVIPLRERGVDLSQIRAGVFGAGGAGRAAAAGLAREGAQVTLVNRSEERGRKAAEALHVDFEPWDSADPSRFEVLIQATPLGSRDDDPLPFDPNAVAESAVVVDMVYGDRPTRLVESLRERGVEAVDGREMLLDQAFAQFRLMTGRDLPRELGRELLGISAE